MMSIALAHIGIRPSARFLKRKSKIYVAKHAIRPSLTISLSCKYNVQRKYDINPEYNTPP